VIEPRRDSASRSSSRSASRCPPGSRRPRSRGGAGRRRNRPRESARLATSLRRCVRRPGGIRIRERNDLALGFGGRHGPVQRPCPRARTSSRRTRGSREAIRGDDLVPYGRWMHRRQRPDFEMLGRIGRGPAGSRRARSITDSSIVRRDDNRYGRQPRPQPSVPAPDGIGPEPRPPQGRRCASHASAASEPKNRVLIGNNTSRVYGSAPRWNCDVTDP
jgi:hypothetical protein